MSESEKERRKLSGAGEAWTAVLDAERAFTNPIEKEVYTLSELDDNEIRFAVQALTVGSAFKTDLMRELVTNLAVLKRSKKRQGERAVISLVRNSTAKIMQTVQQSRFKRVMSNREDYEND
ncbi:hypothetical protein NTE_01798 [Candidatus Nitrososphaera evergladensis SR1]|uniref:Uncharacterized protein n=1 Tax=Candidatus Nitrososphaera evergladensis SR1 TaxID=1459636 RepID=A0A075MX45_9ARCH|nr:hypothetical protein [Candidatus Nitrososphaera evergladensis]AIF83859.1 hypothetical protein NTE_01798 [Candidatus Nitrososphaera evergladensis SR1]